MKRPAIEDTANHRKWLGRVNTLLLRERHRHPYLVLCAARWIVSSEHARSRTLSDGTWYFPMRTLRASLNALFPALRTAQGKDAHPTDEALWLAAKWLRNEAQEYPS